MGESCRFVHFFCIETEYCLVNVPFKVCLADEMVSAEDLGDYYRIPADKRNLNYQKYENVGNKDLETIEEYNSHNTKRLDVEGMKELLLKLDLFKEDK